MTVLVRSLILAGGLLLTLPPGWCCFAASGYCQAPRPAPDVEKPSSPSCCSHKTPANKTDPIPHRPTPAPRVCCCEHTPAVRPNTQAQLPDLTALLPLSVVDFPPLARARVSPEEPESAALPPPRILHCVWLC